MFSILSTRQILTSTKRGGDSFEEFNWVLRGMSMLEPERCALFRRHWPWCNYTFILKRLTRYKRSSLYASSIRGLVTSATSHNYIELFHHRCWQKMWRGFVLKLVQYFQIEMNKNVFYHFQQADLDKHKEMWGLFEKFNWVLRGMSMQEP